MLFAKIAFEMQIFKMFTDLNYLLLKSNISLLTVATNTFLFEK